MKDPEKWRSMERIDFEYFEGQFCEEIWKLSGQGQSSVE